MTDTTYNGHDSWEHWNVSLWINNDEHLYNKLCNYAELAAYMTLSRADAFGDLMAVLPSETPDGAAYTPETVKPLFDEQVAEQIRYS